MELLRGAALAPLTGDGGVCHPGGGCITNHQGRIQERDRDITLLTGTLQVYMWVDSLLSLTINIFSLSETGQKWHFYIFIKCSDL